MEGRSSGTSRRAEPVTGSEAGVKPAPRKRTPAPRRTRTKAAPAAPPEPAPDFFTLLVGLSEPGSRLADLASRLPAGRVAPPEPHNELEKSTPVEVDCEPRVLEAAVASWKNPETARELVRGLHELDLERAAQPPEIHVTITPPDGVPAGHFVVRTGPDRQISYSLSPDQVASGGTVEATRPVRDRMEYGIEDDPGGG